jgi:hypothetical protein
MQMRATAALIMSKALALRSKLADDNMDMIEYHIQLDLMKVQACVNKSVLLLSLRECIMHTTNCWQQPVDASMFVWCWFKIFSK